MEIRIKRYSNIELLRILSMVMILSLHSFTWNRASGNDGHITNLSIGICFDYFRESLCICAVNVFILISGFFSIKWKLKSFLSFVFQIYFWSLGVYVLLLILGKVNFSNSEFFQRMNCLIGNWWFVEAYLGLYLLAPVLNAFLEKSNRRTILLFVILFVFFESYSQLLGSTRNFDRGYNTIAFCGLYVIGRLLFFYQEELQVLRKKISYVFLLSYFFVAIIISCLALYKLVVKGHDFFSIQRSFVLSYSNPLVIIEAIFLFLIFHSINFSNKWVNYVASSIFAVYLLHMHPNIREWYYSYCGQLYNYSFLHHLIVLIGLFVGIVFLSVLLDKIRLLLFTWLYTTCETSISKKWNITK